MLPMEESWLDTLWDFRGLRREEMKDGRMEI
jgi:hypothetical protein